MASKDFSIVAKVLLNASGFSTGKEMISKESKSLEKGITASGDVIKNSFSTLSNSVLPEFGSQFGALSGVVGGVKDAFKMLIPAMSGVRTAIISTGIGAIVIAISLAIAGLVSWMKRTDEGSDVMRKAFDVIKAVIDVVLDKLSKLGSALYKITQGDFKGAWQDIKDAFTGWGDAMKENIKTAKELNDVQDKLEDFNVTYALKRAKLEDDISEKQLAAHKKQESNGKYDAKANDELKKAKEALFKLDEEHMQLQVDAAQKEYDMGAKNQDTLQKLNDLKAEQVKLHTQYIQGLRETQKLDDKNLVTDEDKVKALEKIKYEYQKINKEIEKGASLKPLQHTLTEGATANNKPVIGGGLLKGGKTLAGAPDQTEATKALNKELEKQTKIYDTIMGSINGITDSFGKMISGTKGGFKDLVTVMLGGIQKIIDGLLAEAIAAAIAKEAHKGLIGLITASVAIAGVMALWSKVPAFAAGGISSGGLNLVGENGAELVNLPSGSKIYNNFQTQNMLKGNNGGGQVRFEIEGTKLVGVINNFNRMTNGYA